jgi:copper(I)-binding protein
MKAFIVLVALAAIAGCRQRTGIELDHVWTRATPPGAAVAAVYARIVANEADELVAISSPAAATAEIHATIESDGMVTMRPLTSVSLPSGIPVQFESGGLHIMLLGLHEPLIAGGTVPVTFTFKSAAPITVAADILAPGGSDSHAH